MKKCAAEYPAKKLRKTLKPYRKHCYCEPTQVSPEWARVPFRLRCFAQGPTAAPLAIQGSSTLNGDDLELLRAQEAPELASRPAEPLRGRGGLAVHIGAENTLSRRAGRRVAARRERACSDAPLLMADTLTRLLQPLSSCCTSSASRAGEQHSALPAAPCPPRPACCLASDA